MRFRILVYRNSSPIAWKIARLPVEQTLIWLGPLFILVQPKYVKRYLA